MNTNTETTMSPAAILAEVRRYETDVHGRNKTRRYAITCLRESLEPMVAAMIEREAALIAERAELLEALQRVMKLHVPYTGNPTHARLVDYWEFEKQQGRGCADDMLFALSAIARAEARHG